MPLGRGPFPAVLLIAASFDDLVSDATAAFRYLHGRAGIDPRRVGLFGHSEGGSIAPAVAAQDRDGAFMVVWPGPD
jgi:acetyl esterase/lipase